MHRGPDSHGLVHRHLQVDGLGNRSLQLRKRRPNTVHGVDNICAGLPIDDRKHSGLAVRVAGISKVFDRVYRPSHIFDSHRGSVVVSDDQRFVFDGLENLVIRADLPGLIAVCEMTFRRIRVSGVENRPHLLYADAVFVKGGGIQFNAHGRQGAPSNQHLAHTAQL